MRGDAAILNPLRFDSRAINLPTRRLPSNTARTCSPAL